MTIQETTSSVPSKCGSSALQMGPHKNSSSDPLVSHGHHFGQTVFALCNYPALLTNGILRLEQIKDIPLEDFPAEERKGAAGTRGNDAKMLKSVILDWISSKGEGIRPPLHRNSKIDRSFNHDLTRSLLCPAGLDWNDPQTKENLQSGEMMVCEDQWPVSLYAHHIYDPEDPWCRLLRSHLLAYKHVFTSPSSVDREPKATQSGNACLYGMNSVTIASLAYIAIQVQFALSLSLVFSRTDTTTDLETFYHSLLDLLEDPEEYKEIDELLIWWNQYFFRSSPSKFSPLLLQPRDPSVPTAPYSRFDKNVWPSNKLQI
ncbi:uncharacterized protein F5891DRAFT_1131003 [Suillus fuscotomentosus]|uniref:Uncharacterized protein n=1 Tax=Suillus fuscotomentosus TaxID=1912939 RepID=A0AAD4DUP2_9AGAM|nr:uncharacterized protein F5891DRAFT_1131003 [Suillus fuscotomentosus]KAG1894275.1 hypothetical protein F5891DRAFT_1131003 [Suillus fuscotomentosus]